MVLHRLTRPKLPEHRQSITNDFTAADGIENRSNGPRHLCNVLSLPTPERDASGIDTVIVEKP